MFNSWDPTTVTAIMYIMFNSMRFTQFCVWKPFLSLFICFSHSFCSYHFFLSIPLFVRFLLFGLCFHSIWFWFSLFTFPHHLSLLIWNWIYHHIQCTIVFVVCRRHHHRTSMPSFFNSFQLSARLFHSIVYECVSFFILCSLLLPTSKFNKFSNEFGWMNWMVG